MTCPHCGQEITAAQIAAYLRAYPSEARSEASRKNGAAPVKPGSRPRGRPKAKK